MNCKPGQMAIIIGTRWNDGKTLTTKKLHAAGSQNFLPALGPIWETDRDDIQAGFLWSSDPDGTTKFIADKFLRPISGGETPEQSAEAMRKLHDTTVPAKTKEPVVKPFEWEKL